MLVKKVAISRFFDHYYTIFYAMSDRTIVFGWREIKKNRTKMNEQGFKTVIHLLMD